ncbi:MAG: aldehyde dehydrogenase family protein [Acidimicrobiia bacterium]
MSSEFSHIDDQLERVRRGFADGVVRAVGDRETQLRQLRRFLVEREDELTAALRSDLGKSAMEAYSTEIGFTINEVDLALSEIRRWTRPERTKLPLHLKPGSAEIVPEPLGTVLVIAPWNYPLQLLLAPLVPALAAGNTVVLKPSEIAAATASTIARLLPDYLDTRAVQVVTGGVPETTKLLEERFDHIFYTGNGTVGKIVMRAAAEHLTPVTLELGGKSPAIVAADARLDVAARRIAWGKFINAGQTCVAPDYVLVEEAAASPLLGELGRAIDSFYGDDPAASADYGRIVSDRHVQRLTALLDADRGTVAIGGRSDRAERYLAPTVVTDVDPDGPLMSEEIFGPILPVITVPSIDAAIDFVNGRPKPLALYVFTERDAVAEKVVTHTSSGGATINHTLLHLAVPEFPFGGVGPSGMGSYHGKYGFDVFTHHKPVLDRATRPDPSLAYPSYGGLKEKLLRKLL